MDIKQDKPNSGPIRETVSPRELKIALLHHVEGLSLADAALAAGSKAKSRHSLNCIGFNAVKNVLANDDIQAEMERQGLTIEYYARKLKEGCESTMFVKEGNDGFLREVPDNNARYKFVETGIKILGGFPPARIEVDEISFEERLLRLEYGDPETEHH